MKQGYLMLVLHSHLPYIHHPKEENLLEERWLFEAITESYVPLFMSWEKLHNQKVPFRLTLSLSPTLMEMLNSQMLLKRYHVYLEKSLRLAESEEKRLAGNESFFKLARMYHERLEEIRSFLERYHDNLLEPCYRLHQEGCLELITTSATHAFLPLLAYPEAVHAQIKAGVDTFRSYFGFTPKGFWLPECAYTAGLDFFLAQEGIKYFFLDTHGILNGTPAPKFGVYAPVCVPSGIFAFGRDQESSRQVWSAKEGYPGDYDYREYYRDIGYDLDEAYINPYLPQPGLRINTGFKYYRITGPGSHKEPYEPQLAKEKAAIHAGNFIFNREKQSEYLYSKLQQPAVILAPYDTELFGHWWFEGPVFLENILRKIATENSVLGLATPGQYLATSPFQIQSIMPSASSWGANGYYEFWLNQINQWIYRPIHQVTEELIFLLRQMRGKKLKRSIREALNQACRELLLLQSSDWPFIMSSQTMVPYAERRVKMHLRNVQKLCEQISAGKIDLQMLQEMRKNSPIFAGLRFEDFFEIDQNVELLGSRLKKMISGR